jgi:hypothetical protein
MKAELNGRVVSMGILGPERGKCSRLHSITTQKIAALIFSVMRTHIVMDEDKRE